MLTWAVNIRVGSLGSSRNIRTPAQHRVVVSSGVTATGCMVTLGGTAGERERGRGGGGGGGGGVGSNVGQTHTYIRTTTYIHTTHHCQAPLTGYKHHASEYLACSNTVPCNHTDSVSHSMHQRQSCHIPNEVQVCRSTDHECHHCAIDCDLEWSGACSKLTQNHSHQSHMHCLTAHSMSCVNHHHHITHGLQIIH